MPFSLLPLSRPELEDVAASRIPSHLVSRLDEGALPPPFVAARSLQVAAGGHPEPWSTSFLIVRNSDGRIIGGGGFKTAPVDGRVEVGYGIAPGARGQGAATGAVRMLLVRAFEAGATEVVAEVSPRNPASARVLEKAGFKQVGSRIDRNNESLMQWLRQSGD